MVRPPSRFAKHIESPRLKRLIFEVWQRIPAPERAIIEMRLRSIAVCDLEDASPPGKRINACIETAGGFVQVGTVKVSSPCCDMFIDWPTLEGLDDLPVMGALAHEFAHVFLAHACWKHAREFWRRYESLRMAAAEDVHEWDVALHLWLWGFHEELMAWGKVSRTPEPPWFIHYKEVEQNGDALPG
jgi:hypothetical protein